MAPIQSLDGLGNMLRLQGLKNVSGRRKVLPGAQFLENLQPNLPDVGTPAPKMNLPQIDTGAGLSPQSYDVRANEILPEASAAPEMPTQENESVWSRFGRALGMQAKKGDLPSGPATPQAPPIATQQVDLSEGLPPVSASQEVGQTPDSSEVMRRLGSALKEKMNPFNVPPQEAAQTVAPPAEPDKKYTGPLVPEFPPSIWTALGDYLSPTKREEMSAENAQRRRQAQAAGEQTAPGEFGNIQEYFRPETTERLQSPESQQLDQAEMAKAQEKPWEISVHGATDAFANQPELVQSFKEYTGIDFSPQVKELTAKYEQVLGDIDKGINQEGAGYDEQAQRIKERILSNEATDMDKYYIGMALLMPLLVGALFGKEAGLGALGGGAQGIADLYSKRLKDTRENEELLADVNKAKTALNLKRGELELEKLKVPNQIKSLLPKDETEDLKGMRMATITDPASGKAVAEGPEVFPDLVADLHFYNTPKKREKMQETASKLEEEKSALQLANNATRDVINAAIQLKDPGILGKMLAIGMSEGIDAGGVSLGANAIKKAYRNGLFGEVPMIKDENGRSVNAALYLDAKIEQIKDAYRRNEQMKAFTTTVASHIGSMAENPLYSGLTADDLVTQMLILRDRGQQFFVARAKGQGFYPQPLTQELGKQNRELYAPLNAREEKKQLEEDKRKLLQGD